MKKLIYFLTILIVLQACKKDDPCENQIAPAGRTSLSSLSITYLDAEGNNLIDNGTFLQSNLRATSDGGEVVTFATTILGTGQSLGIVPAQKEGNQTIQIIINDEITDIIIVNLSKAVEGNECFKYTYYDFVFVKQNDQLFALFPSKFQVFISIIKMM